MTFFMMVFVIVCSGVKIKIELWFLRTGKNTMNSFIVCWNLNCEVFVTVFFSPTFLSKRKSERTVFITVALHYANILPV